MSADTSSVTAAASSADSGNQNSKKNEPVAKVDAHFKNTVFLSTILADIPGKLEVDWNAIASRCGYSNGATAKVRFGQIKKKYLTNENGESTAITPPKTPTKPRVKKEKTEKTAGSGTLSSASKVSKSRASKKKSKVTEEVEPMMDAEGELSGAFADDNGGQMLALEAPKDEYENTDDV